MRKYTVLAALTMAAGTVLGLTAAQAAVRAHALRPLDVDKKTGAGTFEVLAPVQFKIGEVIATDAEMNKQLAAYVESAEDSATKARAKAKADAESRDLAAMKDKAAKWDELEPQLAELQAKAAMFDELPQDVRAGALAKVKK